MYKLFFVDELRKSGLGAEIKAALKSRKIWPFPSREDGEDSGYIDRAAICREGKYHIWQATRKFEKGKAWTLLNGILANFKN